MAGTVLATYLTWVHFDRGSLVCGLGNCHAVQASEFATVGQVPVAVLGVAMYVFVLVANVLIRMRPEMTFVATTAAFTVALAGTIYAAYLTWLEVAVIDAVCQWCVGSALLTVGLLATEGMLLRRVLSAPSRGP